MLAMLILALLALGGVAARCLYTPDADGHAVVPDGVTSIGNSAFQQCDSLVSIHVHRQLQLRNRHLLGVGLLSRQPHAHRRLRL